MEIIYMSIVIQECHTKIRLATFLDNQIIFGIIRTYSQHTITRIGTEAPSGDI